MKHLSSILLITLLAVALAQMYRAQMELKYNYDSLAWQVKGENDQFKAIIATDFQRTHRDAQKITELEAQLKGSAAGKGRTN